MGDLFFLLGLTGGLALLGYMVYAIVRAYFVPKGSTLFKGFIFGPVLKKLDKSKFQIIKKVYPDNENKRNCIDFALVSNYGVFFIRKKDVKGIIEKAQGRDGNTVKYKEHIRFYKDDTAELAKDIEQIKSKVPVLKEVKIHMMIVYPDKTEVRVKSEGFCGNLKDVTNFINECCTAENEITGQQREEIYKAIINEKEKVTL